MQLNWFPFVCACVSECAKRQLNSTVFNRVHKFFELSSGLCFLYCFQCTLYTFVLVLNKNKFCFFSLGKFFLVNFFFALILYSRYLSLLYILFVNDHLFALFFVRPLKLVLENVSTVRYVWCLSSLFRIMQSRAFSVRRFQFHKTTEKEITLNVFSFVFHFV